MSNGIRGIPRYQNGDPERDATALQDPLESIIEQQKANLPPLGPGQPSIYPTPSRASKIGQHLRYGIPELVQGIARGSARRTFEFARTLGAESVGGPGGWITDMLESPDAPLPPETPYGQVGGGIGSLGNELNVMADAAALVRGIGHFFKGNIPEGFFESLSAAPGLGFLVAGPLKALRAKRGLEAMSRSRLRDAISDALPAEGTGNEWMNLLYRTEDVTPKPPHPGGVNTFMNPFEVLHPISNLLRSGQKQQLARRPKTFAEGEGKWTGFQSLLAENPSRVFTRDELLRHMDEYGVKLKETWRGTRQESSRSAREAATKELDRLLDEEDRLGFDRRVDARQAIRDSPDFAERWDVSPELELAAHRFREFYPRGGLQSPLYKDVRVGGPSENYRELTIQLDDNPGSREIRLRLEAELDRLNEAAYFGEPVAAQNERFGRMNEIHRTLDAQRSYDPRGQFTEGHFDEPNVLVHLRMSDRFYVNPATGRKEKVLFLEEIQSDWHEQGRRHGYTTTTKAEISAAKRKYDESHSALEKLRDKYERDHDLVREAYARQIENYEALVEIKRGVPTGPYTPTGEWTELALRRATQEAVEGGYDRVAWATGRQAADATDQLLRDVSRIEYNRTQKSLRAFDLVGDEIVIEYDVTPQQLPDYIGKEPARRLMQQKETVKPPDFEIYHEGDWPYFDLVNDDTGEILGEYTTREEAESAMELFASKMQRESGTRTIKNTDFEEGQIVVGSTGMLGYYDDIVPKTVKKYGKQVGGIEIEEIDLDVFLMGDQYTQGMFGHRWEEQINNSFAVTPEMRRIVGKGDQRLWGAAGLGLLAGSRQRDDEPDSTSSRNGIRSIPRYQEGGYVPGKPLPKMMQRHGIRSIPRYQNGGSSSKPESLERRPQEFNINKDRMENLLDTLNALVGDTRVDRQVTGYDINYPSGMYIPTEEQAPRNFFTRLVDPIRVREGFPPYINLTAAGDFYSRRAGEGFEIDPRGRPMTGEWSPAERMVAMHEFGHGANLNDILSESLERMQEESSAPMYPWHYMGGDEEGGREPPWWQRTKRALDAKMGGMYKREKFATQFGKVVEILQDSLDPERRGEALNRIDSPEMRQLVEGLLKHPVYKDHPFHKNVTLMELESLDPTRFLAQQDVTRVRNIQR